jgi:hypothetical protein
VDSVEIHAGGIVVEFEGFSEDAARHYYLQRWATAA